jgi:hypothetical protein
MVLRAYNTTFNFRFYKRLFNFSYSKKVEKKEKMQVIRVITCIFSSPYSYNTS